MFDQILDLVKQHLSNNPEVADKIPDDKKQEVHQEIATHITNGIKKHAATEGGIGGLLSSLQNTVASGGALTSAIEGGLMGSLTNKLGLSPAVSGAIAAAIPGILQKFAHKANDPNDPSITKESISTSLSNINGGVGKMFG
jgi:uncharacterized protein YidB (DUF937 family)